MKTGRAVQRNHAPPRYSRVTRRAIVKFSVVFKKNSCIFFQNKEGGTDIMTLTFMTPAFMALTADSSGLLFSL
jgi:hypothetical protein